MKTMKLNLLEKKEMNELHGGGKFEPCHTTMGSCGMTEAAKADYLENRSGNGGAIPWEDQEWLHEYRKPSDF